MPGRLDEFALGATYKKNDDGELRNAVTATGNNVNGQVQSAVAGQPSASDASSQGLA